MTIEVNTSKHKPRHNVGASPGTITIERTTAPPLANFDPIKLNASDYIGGLGNEARKYTSNAVLQAEKGQVPSTSYTTTTVTKTIKGGHTKEFTMPSILSDANK